MNVNEEKKKNLHHLFSKNDEEISKVKDIMQEVEQVLLFFANNNKIYYKYYEVDEDDTTLHFTEYNNVDVGKLVFYINDILKFENLLDIIWNENGSKFFDPNFLNGRIRRVYDNNLILLQQTYKGSFGNEGRYFYLLAQNTQLNANTYVISCVSLNVNDNYPKNKKKKFHNPLVPKVNNFSLDLECDENIKNSKLVKMFINLSGYLIEKKDNHIKVTYVCSINLNTSSLVPNFLLRVVKANTMMNVATMKQKSFWDEDHILT
ncbi:fam-a protein [Hepatocystis sp. ex Piliocolobus tephrosceles]|nr:fam-a protein [Hepatocystis sp. ex Piliocolobus tephrosceles]